MFQNKRRMAIKAGEQGRLKMLSSFGTVPSFGGGGMGNMSVSAVGGFYNHVDTYMYGIMPENEKYLRRYYRDMYYHDNIAGSAVDLMSTLPFSEFSLSQVSDEQAEIFLSSIERLNLRTLFPELSVDYMVDGAFLGTLLFKKDKKQFTDIIPQNIDDAEVIPTPFNGVDPLIKLTIPEHMKKFATSNEPYFRRLRERISPQMIEAMQASEVTLDNLTTLYIPRKTFSTNYLGTSLYRRLMPVYLLEKILYRGTITEATRRQRSPMHIMAGNEFWEPTDEDLENLVGLFQQADLDPIGAIIATRNDIQAQDIRPAGDFWKWTDISDITAGMKMRALGISETFLSGDATLATMEVSLSVFVEHIRSFRDMVTRKTFYNKIFPLISVLNGMTKEKETSPASEEEARHVRNVVQALKESEIHNMVSDTSKLVIPKVDWHKNLRPEADREYLDVLNTLSEKGVPISLRTWAAAGGLTLDNLEDNLSDDKALRETIKKFGPDTGEDEDSFSFSSLRQALGAIERVGFFNRDFGEESEIKGKTKTGKDRYIYNQKKANEEYNVKLLKALSNLEDNNTYKLRVSQGKVLLKNLGDVD